MKKKLKKITKATITHVSFVPKGANGQDFLIVKGEEAPNMQFDVPILKVDEEQRLVTGIVYAPDVVDSQGEFMEADAIEKTAHDFMADYRLIDAKHSFVANENVVVVESFVAKADMELEGQSIKKGTWLLTTKICDDTLWESVKKGEFKGYSMGGTGTREEVEMEEKVITKEEKGLMQVIREFFAQGAVAKEDTEAVSVVDFSTLATAEVIENTRWAFNDAMRNILRSNATNKRELLEKQMDSYKAFILSQFDSVAVEKACELFAEPVIKAGKQISSANAEKIKAAYASLGELITSMDKKGTPEKGESEENMKKEDMEKVLKAVMLPLEERLVALEKEDKGKEADTAIGKEAEALAAIVKEAILPITERLDKVEKARGLSRQIEDDNAVEKANEGYFTNIQI